MTERQLPLNIVTVVWGDWHSSAFLTLNVPTLLAPGNLPALADRCSATYDIYTQAADVDKFEHSQISTLIRLLMPVRINIISEELLSDPIRAHRVIWIEATEKAKREGAAVLLVPPDVAWSDGALGHVGDLLASGKKVIYNFYLRVVSDTFAPEFVGRYGSPGSILAVPPREMVEFSMRHIHPLMAAYCRLSENFPYHPEMVIWPVRGEGLLIRVLAREPLLYDPSAYAVNERHLVDGIPKREETEFIADSDNFFAISLAPLGKDIEWCTKRQSIEFMWLSRWWLHYDSSFNDIVAAAKVRIRSGERADAKWRQVEFAADLFVRRAAMYREALRAWRALHELKCERAAEFLALAMHTGAITRVTALSGHLVIFAPSDDALDLVGESELDGVIQGRDGQGLENLIRAHVVVLDDEEPDLIPRLRRDRPVELTSLDGHKIQLRVLRRAAGAAGLLVNGRYLTSASISTGRSLIVRLEGNLWQTAPAEGAKRELRPKDETALLAANGVNAERR